MRIGVIPVILCFPVWVVLPCIANASVLGDCAAFLNGKQLPYCFFLDFAVLFPESFFSRWDLCEDECHHTHPQSSTFGTWTSLGWSERETSLGWGLRVVPRSRGGADLPRWGGWLSVSREGVVVVIYFSQTTRLCRT